MEWYFFLLGAAAGWAVTEIAHDRKEMLERRLNQLESGTASVELYPKVKEADRQAAELTGRVIGEAVADSLRRYTAIPVEAS
jgi:hypothetical protein